MSKFDMKKLNNIDMDTLKDMCAGYVDKLKEDRKFQKQFLGMFAVSMVLLIGTSVTTNLFADKISEVANKQNQYKEISTFMEKYQKDASNYQNEVKQVTAKVLDSEEVDKAHLVVSKLAENNNVLITNTSKNSKTTNVDNNIFVSGATITVSGTYGNVENFLYAIENENFFISVDSVSISPDKKDAAQVEAKIDYKVFFAKAGASSGKKNASSDNKNAKADTTKK